MKEFYIMLNVTELSPQNPDYWTERSARMSHELDIRDKINAEVSVGTCANIPKKKFYLFASILDLTKTDDLKKYDEVEIKIENVLKKHIRD
jgi:hypothetical protein